MSSLCRFGMIHWLACAHGRAATYTWVHCFWGDRSNSPCLAFSIDQSHDNKMCIWFANTVMIQIETPFNTVNMHALHSVHSALIRFADGIFVHIYELWRIKFKAIINNKTRMRKELFSTDWNKEKKWKNNNKWFDAFASIMDHEPWADDNKKSWEEKQMLQIVLIHVISYFCMDF